MEKIGQLDHLLGNQEEARTTLIECRDLAVSMGPEHIGTFARATWQLADVVRCEGSNDLARLLYSEALHQLTRLGDISGQANVLRGLGDLEWCTGHTEFARTNYESSLALFRKVGERPGEASVLLNTATLELMLGQTKLAREDCYAAGRLFQRAGDRVGEVNALNGLGELEFLTSEPEAAKRRYSQARGLAQEIGYEDGEATAVCGLGDVELIRGQVSDAESLYQIAFKLYEKNRDSLGLSRVLRKQAELGVFSGDLPGALDRFERARSLSHSVQERNGEADALANIAKLDDARGRHDLANERYKAALALMDDNLGKAAVLLGWSQHERVYGDRAVARKYISDALQLSKDPNALRELAYLDYLDGRYGASRTNLASAFDGFGKRNDAIGQANVYLGYGLIESAEGNHAAAHKNYSEARGIFQASGDSFDEANADRMLADEERVMGMKADAKQNLNRAAALFDKLSRGDAAAQCRKIADRLSE
jgi:tetratricopeptide (TPR) repeat protein